MAQGHVGINTDYGDWEWSTDAGERARLLQSPSVETGPKSREEQQPAATSMLGAVFIVVNAALGAGLLNFPAAFSMAGGVAAGIALQMVRAKRWWEPPWGVLDKACFSWECESLLSATWPSVGSIG